MTTRTTIDERGHEVTVDEESGRCTGVKIPSFMMDAKPPPSTHDQFVADHAANLAQHAREGAAIAQHHRPGNPHITDSQRRDRNAHILEHRRRLEEAWHTPAPSLPPTADAASTRAPTPTRTREPTTSEQALRERDQRLADAWRAR